jgi:hypothetical protein
MRSKREIEEVASGSQKTLCAINITKWHSPPMHSSLSAASANDDIGLLYYTEEEHGKEIINYHTNTCLIKLIITEKIRIYHIVINKAHSNKQTNSFSDCNSFVEMLEFELKLKKSQQLSR